MEIRWTSKAAQNFEDIEYYLSQEDPKAAAKIVHAILNSVELLSQHPGMGRAGRVVGTRELIVPNTPYLIPYRVIDNQIEILRIFHGAMLWPEKI